jgi:hypothetical protein
VKSYLGIREILRVVVEPTPLEPLDVHLARDDHFAVWWWEMSRASESGACVAEAEVQKENANLTLRCTYIVHSSPTNTTRCIPRARWQPTSTHPAMNFWPSHSPASRRRRRQRAPAGEDIGTEPDAAQAPFPLKSPPAPPRRQAEPGSPGKTFRLSQQTVSSVKRWARAPPRAATNLGPGHRGFLGQNGQNMNRVMSPKKPLGVTVFTLINGRNAAGR